jgi:Putative Actinobacterial Holin-X, holin superfamily III
VRSALLAWIGAAGARIGTAVAVTLAAVLLALAGAALLFAALFLWLARVMEPALAALVTGLVILAAAAIVALIGRMRVKAHRAAAVVPLAGASQANVAALAGSEFGVAVTPWLRAHLPQVALAAAAAGFVLGVSPRLRAALWRLLR